MDSPTSILDNGRHVWVLNSNGNNSWWITELDAATGEVIADYRQQSLGPGIATQMTLDGNQIWVASNYSDDTSGVATGLGYVTEINAATGKVIRRLTSSSYHFDHPEALTVAGGYLWVVNGGPLAGYSTAPLDSTSGSLDKISLSTGALLQTITSAAFDDPQDIAASGTTLWISNNDGNSLTEVSAATGTVVRTVSGDQYQLDWPGSITIADGRGWVANALLSTVTEFNASTGALISVLGASSYHFGPQGAVTTGDGALWVSSKNQDLSSVATGGQVTEIPLAKL
jgi:hypothetical protein